MLSRHQEEGLKTLLPGPVSFRNTVGSQQTRGDSALCCSSNRNIWAFLLSCKYQLYVHRGYLLSALLDISLPSSGKKHLDSPLGDHPLPLLVLVVQLD